MNALSTFLDRLFFAVACILGWVVFPALIAVGGAALLGYAVVAEIVVSISGAAAPAERDRLAARKIADRMCGTLQP